MKRKRTELVLTLVALISAGVPPNLFPIAQAGYGNLSVLAVKFLIPSVALIAVVLGLTVLFRMSLFRKQILRGIASGLVATVGLEVIREIGFRMGWMPGDMPKLLGVLLLDRFALGPNFWSNLAGWGYHFWNGAAFGIVFSLLFARTKTVWAVVYAVLIGVGFMVGPAVKAMGIGVFGLEYMSGYQFVVVVALAHVVFGIILGVLLRKWNGGVPNIVDRLRVAFT